MEMDKKIMEYKNNHLFKTIKKKQNHENEIKAYIISIEGLKGIMMNVQIICPGIEVPVCFIMDCEQCPFLTSAAVVDRFVVTLLLSHHDHYYSTSQFDHYYLLNITI